MKAFLIFSIVSCAPAQLVVDKASDKNATTLLILRNLPEHFDQSSHQATKVQSAQQLQGEAALSAKPKKLDYNKETKIRLPPGAGVKQVTGTRKLPASGEALVGLIWILIVGGMPVVIISNEGDGKTLADRLATVPKTQWIICVTTWLSFFGGFYLFTQVIHFQSSHFDHNRTLTVVECVYLMSQILTTVGYGDITPAYPRGQVFVALYVVFAILIIANIVTEVATIVTERVSNWMEELRAQAQELAAQHVAAAQDVISHAAEDGDGDDSPPEETGLSPRGDDAADPPPQVEYKHLIIAIVTYACFCVAGAGFFVNYPGEGKSVMEAVYMSVITLSTVGFGVVTPTTEGGKIFASFWMLFGTGALVNVVSRFTELCGKFKLLERYKPLQDASRLEALMAPMPSRMDDGEFLKVSLQRWGLLGKDQIEKIEELFKEQMENDELEDGMVNKDVIRETHYVAPPPRPGEML